MRAKPENQEQQHAPELVQPCRTKYYQNDCPKPQRHAGHNTRSRTTSDLPRRLRLRARSEARGIERVELRPRRVRVRRLPKLISLLPPKDKTERRTLRSCTNGGPSSARVQLP